MAERKLEQLIKTLVEENCRLKERIAHLESELAKACKNSSTSSKPPSSDIVKPPKKPKKTDPERPRKAGGQNGHPKHERMAVPPELLDTTT
ncbi:hypothetical protein GOV10_00960, partial [Candidatus Woesearchaeota archaeon]|nr:hypothetical protein [Candidatus Woesearchaeota archaeon]